MFRKIIAAVLILSASILLVSVIFDFLFNSIAIIDRLFPFLTVIIVAGLNLKVSRYLWSGKPIKFIFNLTFTLLFFISSIMTSFVAATMYVDVHLKDKSYPTAYSNCHKVWSARGLVPSGPDITHTGTQNSIESISLAFESGAHGAEVDVHYDAERGEFIVAHDKPYNLKNGAILTLESLFNATGKNGSFWLDFKKLRHLDKEQLAQSVIELERLAKNNGLKDRIYVEGEAPFSLLAYRDAGFFTIFDTHPVNDSHPLTPAIINLYKIFFYFGKFTVMGMNYGDIGNPIYGERTRQLLFNTPVFIYHVQDHLKTFQALLDLETVRVILPLNHSLIRYNLNSCSSDE